MARQARELSKSGMYRVTLRGAELFKSDADKAAFRTMTEKYFETGEIYGASLEKTEINLVVKEGENGISMTMKPLITSYARYFNKAHSTSGKLFSGRFISVPIETEEEKTEQLEMIRSGTVKPAKRAAKKSGTQKSNEGTLKQEPKQTEEKEEKQEKIKPKSLPSWLL